MAPVRRRVAPTARPVGLDCALRFAEKVWRYVQSPVIATVFDRWVSVWLGLIHAEVQHVRGF